MNVVIKEKVTVCTWLVSSEATAFNANKNGAFIFFGKKAAAESPNEEKF